VNGKWSLLIALTGSSCLDFIEKDKGLPMAAPGIAFQLRQRSSKLIERFN
jgi:hypothetical protein